MKDKTSEKQKQKKNYYNESNHLTLDNVFCSLLFAKRSFFVQNLYQNVQFIIFSEHPVLSMFMRELQKKKEKIYCK